MGDIVANSARGALMGNRGGAIHLPDRTLGRARWRSKQWIICVLAFKGRHREVMAANRYTELFFHDEPTALAAGHRPCAECQRARFNAYQDAWCAAHGGKLRAPQMDAMLHSARVTRTRDKIMHQAQWRDLPDGVFVQDAETARLLWRNHLYRWCFTGYDDPKPVPRDGQATVITPAPSVAVLRAGYATSPIGISDH